MLTITAVLKKVCENFPEVQYDRAIALFDEPAAEVSTKDTMKKLVFPPYIGMVKEDDCKGIRFNYGLHTQCTKKMTEGDYCVTCHKQCLKNENGKPDCGDIRDRVECDILEYVDPKGRKTINYATYMKKKGVSIEDISRYMDGEASFLPDIHKVLPKVKKVKDPSKPKREPNAFINFLNSKRMDIKKIFESEGMRSYNVKDIAKEAGKMWKKLSVEEKGTYKADSTTSSGTSSIVSSSTSSPKMIIKSSKTLDHEATKAKKAAEREAAKAKKAAEREAAKAKKAEEREAAKAKKAAIVEAAKTKKAAIVEVEDSSPGVESCVSEQSDIPVQEIEYNGVKYYTDAENNVYDTEYCEIGTLINGEIIFTED
jgi:hypothetical protein